MDPIIFCKAFQWQNDQLTIALVLTLFPTYCFLKVYLSPGAKETPDVVKSFDEFFIKSNFERFFFTQICLKLCVDLAAESFQGKSTFSQRSTMHLFTGLNESLSAHVSIAELWIGCSNRVNAARNSKQYDWNWWKHRTKCTKRTSWIEKTLK